MLALSRHNPGETNLSELDSSDLKTIYQKPTPRVIAKARPEIDRHAKKFIEASPFCVLATSGTDGSVDASPRGGNPGFVHVKGPNELLMPDRAGNNRIDSFRNIVEGSSLLQLIFFVPGIDETLRVGGKGPPLGRAGTARGHGGIRQAAARGAAHRGEESLFPLRQGVDALAPLVKGSAGCAHRLPLDQRGDPRPDQAWRGRIAGRGRSALQDTALSRAHLEPVVPAKRATRSVVQSEREPGPIITGVNWSGTMATRSGATDGFWVMGPRVRGDNRRKEASYLYSPLSSPPTCFWV